MSLIKFHRTPWDGKSKFSKMAKTAFVLPDAHYPRVCCTKLEDKALAELLYDADLVFFLNVDEDIQEILKSWHDHGYQPRMYFEPEANQDEDAGLGAERVRIFLEYRAIFAGLGECEGKKVAMVCTHHLRFEQVNMPVIPPSLPSRVPQIKSPTNR